MNDTPENDKKTPVEPSPEPPTAPETPPDANAGESPESAPSRPVPDDAPAPAPEAPESATAPAPTVSGDVPASESAPEASENAPASDPETSEKTSASSPESSGETPPEEIAASEEWQPAPKRRRIWLRWLGGLFLVLLLACGGAGWLGYAFLNGPGTDPAVAPAQNVEVTINPGMTFRDLTPDLVRLGTVRDADKFRLLLRWMTYRKIPHSLKPGRFRLNTGWTPQQVIDQLVNGSPLLDRVTIPEGLTWWEVGERLEEAQMVRFEDFDKLIHEPDYLRYWGIPFDSAEGFLFPDTYLIMRPLELNGATAKSVVGRLIDNFWRRTAPLWPDGKRPGPSGRDDVRKLVTLASIVERETAIPSERPRVAGVYANRLRLDMLLQADPTTAYGLGKDFDGNLRRRHLDDESNPYNTYKQPGLPPGPICSPGLACLRAAAKPEAHDYLYFVARGGDGSHVFSTNLADHNKAVREYWAKKKGK